MAQIMNQEEQNKALKNINESIRSLKKINEFLTAANPSGVYALSFKDQEGKKHIAEIRVDEKSNIASLVMGFKEKENARIKALAESTLISLDPEDHEIMDFRV